MFHEIAEWCLRFGLEPHHFELGFVWKIDGFEVEFDREMQQCLYAGLDWIDRFMLEHEDAILKVETRVDISPWTGERGARGTSDVIIIVPSKRVMVVFDWKYGRVDVSPVENDQLILYALGAWASVGSYCFADPDENVDVLLKIEQPRIPDGGGEWWTTMHDLLDEGYLIAADAAATNDPDAPRVPDTKQCRYCRASGTCGVLAAHNLDVFGLKFEDLDDAISDDARPPTLPRADDLSAERRSYILLHDTMLTKWLATLHADAMDDALHGRPVPMMKAVEGRKGDRKFVGDDDEIEAEVREIMGDEAYEPPKLVSLTAVEAKMGRKAFAERFEGRLSQAKGRPKLVPLSAPGEPIRPVHENFSVLE